MRAADKLLNRVVGTLQQNDMQSQQTIQVLIRARPVNAEYDLESADGDGSSAIKVNSETSVVSFTRERKGQSDFQFTKVFDQNSSQKQVYDMCNVANDVVGGINCCVMAYGQTGSGKTYTMYGSGWEETAVGADARLSTARLDANDMNRSTDSGVDLAGPKADESFEGNTLAPDEVLDGEEESLGIIPRAVADLFKILEEKALANSKFDYSVSKCTAIFITFHVYTVTQMCYHFPSLQAAK